MAKPRGEDQTPSEMDHFQKWVGSKTIYSCEDPTMLIKKNATHGFETVAVECVSTSRFQPWWINLEKLTECQPNLGKFDSIGRMESLVSVFISYVLERPKIFDSNKKKS